MYPRSGGGAGNRRTVVTAHNGSGGSAPWFDKAAGAMLQSNLNRRCGMTRPFQSLSSFFIAAAEVFASSGVAAQDSGAAVARAYRQSHEAEIIRDFAELLAIPNVARDSAGINRNAAYIRDALRDRDIDAD